MLFLLQTTLFLVAFATECCQRRTAECHACQLQITVEEFCVLVFRGPSIYGHTGCELPFPRTKGPNRRRMPKRAELRRAQIRDYDLECCTDWNADCNACRYGVSKARYCKVAGKGGLFYGPVPGCSEEEEATPAPVPAVTTEEIDPAQQCKPCFAMSAECLCYRHGHATVKDFCLDGNYHMRGCEEYSHETECRVPCLSMSASCLCYGYRSIKEFCLEPKNHLVHGCSGADEPNTALGLENLWHAHVGDMVQQVVGITGNLETPEARNAWLAQIGELMDHEVVANRPGSHLFKHVGHMMHHEVKSTEVATAPAKLEVATAPAKLGAAPVVAEECTKCWAYTAECLACHNGKTVDQYCEDTFHRVPGCKLSLPSRNNPEYFAAASSWKPSDSAIVKEECQIDGSTMAEEFACSYDLDVLEFCTLALQKAGWGFVDGCADHLNWSCCKDETHSSCRACEFGVTEKEFCLVNTSTPGCHWWIIDGEFKFDEYRPCCNDNHSACLSCDMKTTEAELCSDAKWNHAGSILPGCERFEATHLTPWINVKPQDHVEIVETTRRLS